MIKQASFPIINSNLMSIIICNIPFLNFTIVELRNGRKWDELIENNNEGFKSGE